MDTTVAAFETVWTNQHVPPIYVSADVEFLNKFSKEIHYFSVKFKPVPARRHNKLGVVERKDAVVRILIDRLSNDSQHALASRRIQEPQHEILSRDTYLSNIHYGSKLLSSFELARGYTPLILGIPKSPISDECFIAYQEQTARRAIKLLEKTHNPQVPTLTDFQQGAKVYLFKRGRKLGTWELGYVRQAHDHFLLISSNEDNLGKPIRTAFEDVCSVLGMPLLQKLDSYAILFPISHSIVPGLEEVPELEDINVPENENTSPDEKVPSFGREILEVPLSAPSSPEQDLIPKDLEDPHGIERLFDEETPYGQATQAHFRSSPAKIRGRYLARKRTLEFTISHDITERTQHPGQEKYVEKVPITSPAALPFSLKDSEQHVLREIKNTVGYSPTTEFQLQFASR